MIGLGSMVKLAKGSLTPDDLAELASSMGMEIEINNVDISDAGHAFRHAALAAAKPGAKIAKVSGYDRAGAQLEAIFIIAPARSASNTFGLDQSVQNSSKKVDNGELVALG
jgi:hypothetical protein